MSKDELKSTLEQHKLWLDGDGGKRADLRGTNLQGADMRRANLQDADLRGADMRGADMRRANLQGADMRWADMQDADMQDADMRRANLQGADLRGADLRGADLDWSCLPLWRGSKKMKVDKRIAAQIAAHFCALDCDDADYIAARDAVLAFAQTSHMAVDLGLLEEVQE